MYVLYHYDHDEVYYHYDDHHDQNDDHQHVYDVLYDVHDDHDHYDHDQNHLLILQMVVIVDLFLNVYYHHYN